MMATTTVQTVDLAQLIADTLTTNIDGLRVHWYVADIVRPPAVVIGQPDIDYTDNNSGFCSAAWTFPLTLMVARNDAREAQRALSQFLADVVSALAVDVPGVFSVDPIDARPITVTVGGQDFPGYAINIRIRA